MKVRSEGEEFLEMKSQHEAAELNTVLMENSLRRERVQRSIHQLVGSLSCCYELCREATGINRRDRMIGAGED